MMLTQDMKRVIAEQRLGFVATVAPDGTPNVSPKGSFAVLDDCTIAFGEIRSPGTIRNLRANPRVEVNFVDVFVRKGYRFAGLATMIERGETQFDTVLPRLQSAFAHRIRTIVMITVTRALPLTSPSYDDGKTETELRRAWTARLRKLQPHERFEE
jgi:predicted pyridoxine 5'-phosphate oxidase superfamily flavin-nucleotide-binding protein